MTYIEFIFRDNLGYHLMLPLVGVVKWFEDGVLAYHLHVPKAIGWTDKLSYSTWHDKYDILFDELEISEGDTAPEIVLKSSNEKRALACLRLKPEVHDDFLAKMKERIVRDIQTRLPYEYDRDAFGNNIDEKTFSIAKHSVFGC
ncbi:MAG: hypothetical protein JXR97_08460 [Planctomycetes bacterium]|nr:hypothetical protein [Planctomycetota bacterium]